MSQTYIVWFNKGNKNRNYNSVVVSALKLTFFNLLAKYSVSSNCLHKPYHLFLMKSIKDYK